MNIVTGESPENVARRCFIHLWPQGSLFFEEIHQPGLPFISIIAVYRRKQGRYQDAQRDLEAHFDERDFRRAEIEVLLATVANMLEFSNRC
jgi:hypothetical protein